MMLCSGGGRSWVVPHTGGEQPLRAGRESRWGGEEVINECPIAALPLEGGHRGAWGWLWWPGLVVPMQRGSPCSGAAGGGAQLVLLGESPPAGGAAMRALCTAHQHTLLLALGRKQGSISPKST